MVTSGFHRNDGRMKNVLKVQFRTNHEQNNFLKNANISIYSLNNGGIEEVTLEDNNFHNKNPSRYFGKELKINSNGLSKKLLNDTITIRFNEETLKFYLSN